MTEDHWIPVSASIVGTIGATLALAILAAPADADTVAALFPPWWSPSSVMEAATSAGAVIDAGRIPSSLIVRGDRSTLAARLRSAGALVVLNASNAGGCRTRRSEPAA